MKVASLISGGKDSCFNLMQCVAEGHEVVALANLKPQNKDELDSYMYQTVGHQAIDLYADALQLPLYRRHIQGSAFEVSADYKETKDDEVEDLYQLLLQIKEELNIEAVSVGAILSNYQRVRVENVCSRLGVTVLAYLWRRDQIDLMAEMIACNVEAMIIKVAALGLTPTEHLGKTIKELYPHLLKMNKVYGLNVCGEGGEYETFTLDCPLFVKRIVVDEYEMVMHSDDAFAPVAYLNFTKMHLEDKPVKYNLKEQLLELPLKHSRQLMSELFPEGLDVYQKNCNDTTDSKKSQLSSLQFKTEDSSHLNLQPKFFVRQSQDGYIWISGLVAQHANGSTIEEEIRTVLDQLIGILARLNLGTKDLVAVNLYVSCMEDFAAINSIYRKYFSINPPVRVCVEVPSTNDITLTLDCVAYDTGLGQVARETMHVQGISHWAPANIGPYSQAIKVDPQVFVAGQIALCPATMMMVTGGGLVESRLSLHHVDRILKAVNPSFGLNCVTLAICYTTNVSVISSVHEELERALDLESRKLDMPSPLVACVVVPKLPRQAQVEWHVLALACDDIKRLASGVAESSGTDAVIYKFEARKCLISEESFLIPFVISVECTDKKTSSETLSSYVVMSGLLGQLAEILRKGDCSWMHLHCLRLFYLVETFSRTELQHAYIEEFCHIFDCSHEDNLTAITFVPVKCFQSPHCLMMLCHS